MRDFSEMFEKVENKLEQRAAIKVSSARPDSPTAIVYAGRRSMEAQKEIERTLRRVWRAQADKLCHFLMDDSGYFLCSGGQPVSALTIDDVIDQTEGMFGTEDGFRQRGDLFLVLIQNTEQYEDIEHFRRDYMAVEDFAEKMNCTVRVLKIVLLDESYRSKDMAEQIRGFLRRVIQDGEVQNRKTMILSSRLRSGQLLKNQMLRENYILAGNVILIANGCAKNFTAAYTDMYPVGSSEMLTASYSRITRPNRDICEVMTNTILQCVTDYLKPTEPMSTGDIQERLGIQNFLSGAFRKYVLDNIPRRETLESLPRSTGNLEPIGNLPFNQFDRLTMGSFELFFKENVQSLCTSEMFAEKFRRDFEDYVCDRFTHREAASSLTEQNIEVVLRDISIDLPNGNLTAFQYMNKRVEATSREAMIPICREVMNRVRRDAEAYLLQVQELVEEFNMHYMMEVEPTVKDFYEQLVKRILDGDTLGKELKAQLDGPKMSNSRFLDMIYDIIAAIIGKEAVFNMPLDKEMERRLGGNSSLVQSTVQKLLLDSLGDKIRLKTAISPNKSMDIMLNDGQENIFSFLQEKYPDLRWMDTQNGSTAELIQFFRVVETVI